MSRPFQADALDAPAGVDDAPAGPTAFIPLLVLSVVLVAWFAFQAVQLRVERDAMRELMTTQDKQVQDSQKLRDSLDAIARGTAALADGGNANAKLIVDELKRRGVTIAPNAAPAVPAGAPAAK